MIIDARPAGDGVQPRCEPPIGPVKMQPRVGPQESLLGARPPRPPQVPHAAGIATAAPETAAAVPQNYPRSRSAPCAARSSSLGVVRRGSIRLSGVAAADMSSSRSVRCIRPHHAPRDADSFPLCSMQRRFAIRRVGRVKRVPPETAAKWWDSHHSVHPTSYKLVLLPACLFGLLHGLFQHGRQFRGGDTKISLHGAAVHAHRETVQQLSRLRILACLKFDDNQDAVHGLL